MEKILFLLNLQLFADGEGESSGNAEPAANVEPQDGGQAESSSESVNAEGGEVATPQEGKPIQSPEENAKYAAVRREAEQKAYLKAQDDLIASMYGDSHGIYTKADYDIAIQQQMEQEMIEELSNQQIPEHIARRLIESEKKEKQWQQERAMLEQQQQKERNMLDFITAFPNVKAEEIPVEVWKNVESGIPLKYAYIEHQYKLIQNGQETQKKNQENADISTGSVKGKLDITNDHITAETFEAKKHDQSWVKKNFTKIMESRAKW